MKQREVTDKENIKWTCVQAYSGSEGKIAEKAVELSEGNEGTVSVVCTPNGGAQTVRINLNKNWEDQLAEEDLLEAIKKQKDKTKSSPKVNPKRKYCCR